MKVAITGASGFVGRHVLRQIAGRGATVVALCRPTTDAESLRDRLPEGCRIVVGTLDGGDAVDFSRLGEPDVLIHLAWGGLPNYHSLHHLAEELPLQCRFLDSMVKGGLRSLVVTGTCFEYGMRNGQLSDTLTPQPENAYALAKVGLLRYLERLKVTHPFELTWARLFYMYGEGQNPRSLYALLRKAVMSGDAEFPMSQGEQLRDYLPAETVARYIVELALRDCGGGVVNICSGEPVSIRRLVEEWMSELGGRTIPKLGCYPYPDYEPMAFWGHAGKLRSLLGEKARK